METADLTISLAHSESTETKNWYQLKHNTKFDEYKREGWKSKKQNPHNQQPTKPT